jgi:transcriptional regulator with XRE-family HTH domain
LRVTGAAPVIISELANGFYFIQKFQFLYKIASIMPTPPSVLYRPGATQLVQLGARLKDARLRRRFSAEQVATRAGFSRYVLTRIEKGDPNVSIGNVLHVLRVLGLESDVALVAKDDPLGRLLQDEGLPQRKRAPRKRPTLADGTAPVSSPGKAE